MNCSTNKRGQLVSALLAGAGMAYPFVVHAVMGRVPPGAFVLLVLVLIGLRFMALRGTAIARTLAVPLGLAFAGTIVLGLMDAQVAALAYPVMMNLAFAAAFGWSLRAPPSLVQVFASITEPDPSPVAIAYMRTVSLVWCVFLTVNALIALALALWADRGLWALYTGLISYGLMGLLFAGEWLVRQRVKGRAA
ncbi:hypothetical protein MSR1_10040 [Magnetospirillum gryphiswaldense MSR-1]|nr:hypothetical protein MSR1_10040 [Magnetospirillum gryphiswaldense MSR-1]AVM77406.1 hypothetical protein MSR1L_10040 [Magnetospirillum gryphiswaldense]